MSREFRMLPYPGSLLEQPSGVIERFEIVMRIRSEEEERSIERASQEPPPKS